MSIWTYVRNADPKSKIYSIDLEGGLVLRIGTYANLSNSQLQEVYSSGVGAILEEGIVPPASNAGGGSTYQIGTIVPPFAANSLYRQYQAVLNENKIYIAKVEFESGSSFKEENWTLVSGSGGGSGVGTATLWAPNTEFKENQIVVHEGETLRTLKNFKSGATYEF